MKVTEYVKHLIKLNELANTEINELEKACAGVEINNDKDKANFGNLCILLSAMRRIDEATEAMLINENVLKDENDGFYQKIELDEENPETNPGGENANTEGK